MQATNRLQAIIEPSVSALGYELVGIEYLPQGRYSLLRVYIDSEAGITVDDCEKVSRQLSGVLDVEDPIKGQYSLEISSPGLDRPLFTPEHFARFAGQQVQVRLQQPLNGQRKFKGLLRGMDGEEVLIEIDGGELRVLPEEIDKANLIPQWD